MREGTQNIVVVSRPPDGTGPLRAIRAFVAGSLLAAAGGIVILLVGAPIALVARLIHDLIAWLTGG